MTNSSLWEQLSRIVVGSSIDRSPGELRLVPLDLIYHDSTLRAIYAGVQKLVGDGHITTAQNIALQTKLDVTLVQGYSQFRTSDLSKVLDMLPEAATDARLKMQWDGAWRQIINGEGSPEEKIAKIYLELSGVGSGKASRLVPLGDALQSFMAYARDTASGKITRITMPEMWGLLHQKTVMKPTDALCLLGSTGDGKTMALLQLALYWAEQGFCVFLISTETTEVSLGGKVLSGLTALEQEVMLARGISEYVERMALAEVKRVEQNGRLYLIAAEPSLAAVMSGLQAGLFHAMAMGMMPLFIVDYVQKIHDVPGDSERERFANFVNYFKSFLLSTARTCPPGAAGAVGSQMHDGHAWGAKAIEQYVQVVIRIEPRGEAREDAPWKDANGQQKYVCPECGWKIKTHVRDGIVLCKSCNSVVQKIFWQIEGGRSAATTLTVLKNNDGSTFAQDVQACWFNIHRAFYAVKRGENNK